MSKSSRGFLIAGGLLLVLLVVGQLIAYVIAPDLWRARRTPASHLEYDRFLGPDHRTGGGAVRIWDTAPAGVRFAG